MENLGGDLLRYKENQKIVFFDFETESLNLFYARPWQIAYIVSQGKSILKEKEAYIKINDLSVSKDAADITRFSMEEYERKAVNARKVYDEFAEILEDPEILIVGQNILGFDVYIKQVLARYLGIKPTWNFITRCIDTVALGRALQQEQLLVPKDPEERLLWQYRWLHNRDNARKQRASLSALCKLLDIEYSKDFHHDALYDVRKTREIFMKMIWQMEI